MWNGILQLDNGRMSNCLLVLTRSAGVGNQMGQILAQCWVILMDETPISYWYYPHASGISIFGYEFEVTDIADRQVIEDANKRGYVFGRFFSIGSPTGELGSNHASRMIPISEDIFNQAKKESWNVELILL